MRPEQARRTSRGCKKAKLAFVGGCPAGSKKGLAAAARFARNAVFSRPCCGSSIQTEKEKTVAVIAGRFHGGRCDRAQCAGFQWAGIVNGPDAGGGRQRAAHSASPVRSGRAGQIVGQAGRKGQCLQSVSQNGSAPVCRARSVLGWARRWTKTFNQPALFADEMTGCEPRLYAGVRRGCWHNWPPRWRERMRRVTGCRRRHPARSSR